MKTLILGFAAFAFLNGSMALAQDVKRGEKLFGECAACHSTDPAAKDTVGPSLHGVIGRKAGEGTEFRYSPAMKRSGITWSADALNTFISDPQKLVPGNRMPYSGLPEAKDRADLVAYLQATMK